ncbi:branched-chain amino acid ABC transporter substrate-binding protein [Helicobacter valdiviensis]|uniref:Branched-chain amino acid ABC transporter substrate-binding protein n=1 Tax=Helicobacter valdiviensis TaxID=1458358 RepID=A0A2W6MV41_9HELI|nr:ABC transporter substrate-binding protein [Helicobacter valdiviensis]PZT47789.1 branched-chain amino acid ABC transporter substrate-binding protein [Helicobacter valdiviensis]
MKKMLLSLALVCGVMANAEDVKIGVVLPMSGAVGGFGELGKRGIDLAYEAKSTTKNGDKIQIILVDNKSDKIESANAMQKLVSSDKVSVVIGPMISTNALAMTKIADDNKTPLISPVATNDRVTKGKKYVSRISFADSFQGIIAANLAIKDLGAKKVAILFDNSSDYSIGLAKAFRRQIKKLGGEVVIETNAQAGTHDFKAQLSSIKAKNPDALYLPIYYTEGALIASQAQQLGLKVPTIGGDGLTSNKIFFEIAKEAGEGYMVTDYYSTSSKQTAEGEKFIKAYQDKYKEEVSTFSAMLADAYGVAVQAIEQCGAKDKECINDKIRNVKDYEGISGKFSLNNGEAIRSAVINEVKNGKLVYKTTIEP